MFFPPGRLLSRCLCCRLLGRGFDFIYLFNLPLRAVFVVARSVDKFSLFQDFIFVVALILFAYLI
jgi:hypothetical protein